MNRRGLLVGIAAVAATPNCHLNLAALETTISMSAYGRIVGGITISGGDAVRYVTSSDERLMKMPK